MPLDSVILTIDAVRCNWPERRSLLAYAVTTAVDNLGRVHLGAPAGCERLVHRPLTRRPAVWDTGRAALIAYRSSGAPPAVIAYAVTLVRARGPARAAGDIAARLRDLPGFARVQRQLALAAAPAWPASVALGFLAELDDLVAAIVDAERDTVIDTVFGAVTLPRGDARRGRLDGAHGEQFDVDVELSTFIDDDERDDLVDPPAAGTHVVLAPPPAPAPSLALAADDPREAPEVLPSPAAPIGVGRVKIGARRVEVVYAEHAALAVMEGDIVLGTTDALARSAADIGASLGFGVGVADEQLIWPNGHVPYALHPDLAPEVRERVAAAIEHWTQRTPLRFVARADTDRDWLEFVPSTGCASFVGRQGDRQEVWLSRTCSVGNVIHELGHAIGLWHEQSREDRDGFVTVLWDNIQPGSEHNFAQHVADGVDLGAYDYASIMHYSARAFSKDDRPTLVAPPGVEIGQRRALSPGDVAAVRDLYPHLAWGP